MRRVVRWLMWSVAALVGLAAAGLAYVFVVYPNVQAPSAVKIERTPERLARGAYLAEHVAACTDCHSERDFSRYSGPVIHGTKGKGGMKFGPELGLPGTVVAPNITPHALSSWSDGELIQAITEGVTPEGRALFPLMPYQAFASMCEEDVLSMVAYLRTLESVKSAPARTQLDFPFNMIVRTIPKTAQLTKKCPDGSDSVELGRYLATAGGCADCHTPRNGPDVIKGKELSGAEFKLPGNFVQRASNITPDVETGIGSWSKEVFINRFKQYRDKGNLHQVGAEDRQTIMPWSQFAGMSEADLGALYDYLRTVKPVRTDSAVPVAQR